MRVPTSGGIQGIVTSEHVLGRYTHWDAYRTVPCTDNDCTLCREGNPKRWQGYISVMNQLNQRQVVLQVTPLAAQALAEAKLQYGKLRGLLALFSRIAKRPNARIHVETRQLPQPILDLPPGVDIPRYMAVIWSSNQTFRE